ncbi:transposase [Streptomyces tanashiensis]|uniref:transposase n=1 Tax=Streptomyces tanashiensis TaxID=67367 RepID=UPI0033CABDFE
MRSDQRVVPQPLRTAPRRCPSGQPACAHRLVRTPSVLREHGLLEGDLRRADRGADHALPAADAAVAASCGGRRGGAGRPGRCPDTADLEHGNTYGTLLVDASTRLPLTLWEGRDADRLSRWLREHPGVEIACRDGSLTYRQGITGGAPAAVQVSDRFHLRQGLSRRVQDIASAHRGCLPAALPPASESDPVPAEETARNTAEDSRAARHARTLFEAVHALTRTGRSHSSVARELGLDRRTVGKYARARTWQAVVRRPPRKPSSLDPYLDYLQQRWDEGQHSAKILHEELQTKGYLGHYQRVKMAVAPLRRGLPVDEPRERPPSPREAARWITTHPHRRHLHINDRLPRLLDHCPELRQTHDLVRRFAAMLDNRDATPLAGWLDDLSHSGLAPLAGLAGAFREDQNAVAQGITTPYNSGVNEGRITDVKLQKRLMAGRADVPLLRHRVVLIAHLRRRYAERATAGPGLWNVT